MRSRTCHFLAFTAAMFWCEPNAAGQTGPIRWSLSVIGGEYDATRGLAYRIYREPEEIRVQLHVSNETGTPIKLTPRSVKGGVSLHIATNGRRVPSTIEWEPVVLVGDDQVVTAGDESEILIDPGKGALWRVRVSSPTGNWLAGAYLLDVSVNQSIARAAAGGAWNGRLTMRQTTLSLTIGPPSDDARERAAALRQAGEQADEERSPDDAMALFESALAFQPNDVTLLMRLGDAYLRARRFNEAISVFERALGVQREGAHSAIATLLAVSYLGVNQQQNAIRVLRQSGTAEDKIPETIAQLRKGLERLRPY